MMCLLLARRSRGEENGIQKIEVCWLGDAVVLKRWMIGSGLN